MDKVYGRTGHICDTKIQVEAVLQILPRIPEHHENARGHNNAEYLNQAVKLQLVISAYHVKPEQDRYTDRNGDEAFDDTC